MYALCEDGNIYQIANNIPIRTRHPRYRNSDSAYTHQTRTPPDDTLHAVSSVTCHAPSDDLW